MNELKSETMEEVIDQECEYLADVLKRLHKHDGTFVRKTAYLIANILRDAHGRLMLLEYREES